MKGFFLVIDGTDGSGKGTQTKKFIERLAQEEYPYALFDFPQYDKPSSYFAAKYLRGEYGGIGDVSAKCASFFYALDRYDASFEIRRALADGKIVISNRYVSASKGHQTAKLASLNERREFVSWLNELEYDILKIPKPDLTVLLHVPADIGFELVANKDERGYLDGKKRDIHESDRNHLKAAEQAYLELPTYDTTENWHVISCVEQNNLLPIDIIHNKLWNLIIPYLTK